MDDKKVIDTMADAVVSAIKENNKINIEPKIKNVATSITRPDNQKEGDIWMEVQAVDSTESDINNTEPSSLLDLFYPVGSIYQTTNNFIDPNIKFGGVWEKLENVFLFASSSAYALGSKGGEATHTLSTSEMPGHNHKPNNDEHCFTTNLAVSSASTARRWVTTTSTQKYCAMTATSTNDILETATTSTVGGNQAHNNMPPYQVVHMWERIQ